MPIHPLAEILTRHPSLTALGFEDDPQPIPEQAAARAKRLQELHSSADHWDAVCTWIRKHLPPTPRSRGYFSSYALKGMAEEELGPLPHGLFIAAMLHCDHRFLRQERHNPNAYFPLSKRRVVGLDRRAETRRRERADGR
ncbi:MAG: hypothetical protein HY328_16855 [Chloroflexi bacterium]|nr:hypothetical protein [Chloroflexota bacterium]